MDLVIEYPFTKTEFPPEAELVLGQEIDRLSEQFPIFDDASRGGIVAREFTRHCCRPVPRKEAIELAAHFLYLILYYNEYSRNHGFVEQVCTFLDAIQGRAVDSRDAVTMCVRDFVQRLQRASLTDFAKLPAFVQACEQSWSAFVWESHSVLGRQSDSVTYRVMRRDTICVRPLLELEKVLDVHSLALERCFGPLTRRLDWLAVEIQYIANDLYSVERDRMRGQENIVAIIAREQGCTLDDAMERVQAEHDELVHELVRRGDELIEAIRTTRLPYVSLDQAQRYLAMLEGCVWGNVAAVLELRSRYRMEGSTAPDDASPADNTVTRK